MRFSIDQEDSTKQFTEASSHVTCENVDLDFLNQYFEASTLYSEFKSLPADGKTFLLFALHKGAIDKLDFKRMVVDDLGLQYWSFFPKEIPYPNIVLEYFCEFYRTLTDPKPIIFETDTINNFNLLHADPIVLKSQLDLFQKKAAQLDIVSHITVAVIPYETYDFILKQVCQRGEF